MTILWFNIRRPNFPHSPILINDSRAYFKTHGKISKNVQILLYVYIVKTDIVFTRPSYNHVSYLTDNYFSSNDQAVAYQN